MSDFLSPVSSFHDDDASSKLCLCSGPGRPPCCSAPYVSGSYSDISRPLSCKHEDIVTAGRKRNHSNKTDTWAASRSGCRVIIADVCRSRGSPAAAVELPPASSNFLQRRYVRTVQGPTPVHPVLCFPLVVIQACYTS